MDLDFMAEGVKLISLSNQWTDDLYEWIMPKAKKDPSYLEMVKKAKGI